jgi:hypothetical protein
LPELARHQHKILQIADFKGNLSNIEPDAQQCFLRGKKTLRAKTEAASPQCLPLLENNRARV